VDGHPVQQEPGKRKPAPVNNFGPRSSRPLPYGKYPRNGGAKLCSSEKVGLRVLKINWVKPSMVGTRPWKKFLKAKVPPQDRSWEGACFLFHDTEAQTHFNAQELFLPLSRRKNLDCALWAGRSF